MMAIPTTYEEYLEQVRKELNVIERMSAGASGLDERIDASNKLLIHIANLLSVGLKFQLPKLSAVGTPPYNTRKFPLDVARTSPGEEVQVPGNSIVAYTDGTLEGIYVRFDNPTNDAVHLYEFNPYYHSLGFSKFWLETTAQSGKYLRLLVLRGLPGNVTGNLDVIKIHAQDVGIYIERDWASTQDEDQTGQGHADEDAGGLATAIDYQIPAGKVFYLDEVVWSIWFKESHGDATLYIDAVKKFEVHFQDEYDGDMPPRVGENDHVGQKQYEHTFTTPIKLTAGEHLIITSFTTSILGNYLWANYNGRLYDA